MARTALGLSVHAPSPIRRVPNTAGPGAARRTLSLCPQNWLLALTLRHPVCATLRSHCLPLHLRLFWKRSSSFEGISKALPTSKDWEIPNQKTTSSCSS